MNGKGAKLGVSSPRHRQVDSPRLQPATQKPVPIAFLSLCSLFLADEDDDDDRRDERGFFIRSSLCLPLLFPHSLHSFNLHIGRLRFFTLLRFFFAPGCHPSPLFSFIQRNRENKGEIGQRKKKDGRGAGGGRTNVRLEERFVIPAISCRHHGDDAGALESRCRGCISDLMDDGVQVLEEAQQETLKRYVSFAFSFGPESGSRIRRIIFHFSLFQLLFRLSLSLSHQISLTIIIIIVMTDVSRRERC